MDRALKNRPGHAESEDQKAEEAPETSVTQDDGVRAPSFELKLPCYSRRVQSKSEPSQVSQTSEGQLSEGSDTEEAALDPTSKEPRSPVSDSRQQDARFLTGHRSIVTSHSLQ